MISKPATSGASWACALLDLLDASEFRPKTIFTAQVFINPWKEHVHDTLALGRVVYQTGLEIGDLDSVSLATVGYTAYAYLSGKELAPLEREIAAYAETVATMQREASLYRLQIYRQTILNLLGQSEDPGQLRGAVYDVQRSLPDHLARHDGTSAFAVYLNQLILLLPVPQARRGAPARRAGRDARSAW